MDQKLFTELRTLYSLNWGKCNVIRIRIRTLSGVELNTEESNYHFVSFSWKDNWIIMDISHAITDGTGAYEVIRTFLFYYVSSRYDGGKICF